MPTTWQGDGLSPTRSGFLVNTERVMISIHAVNRDEISGRCRAKVALEVVGSTANRRGDR